MKKEYLLFPIHDIHIPCLGFVMSGVELYEYMSISYVINLITQSGHILAYKSTSYNMWLICRAFLMSRTPERVLLQSRSISSLHLVLVLLSAEVSSYSSLAQRGARSGETVPLACTTRQRPRASRRYGSSHLRLHEQGYAKVNCIPAHHVVLIQ